ncbi:MAG: hypothetical protein U9N19_10185 [Thermodesulfobacteriota bacterium]|nr:hypothetical protein [Thermodesulfobacteriota bacterium]
MRLDEYVSINNKISRAVNLERDADKIEQIRQFQITPMVQRVLGRFADALEGEPVSAWSLTGPYGSGKSAFCNYLLALCSNHTDSIRETAFAGLKACDERLAKRLRRHLPKPGKNAFIRMRGVSQYESLNKTLLRALHAGLQELGGVNRKASFLAQDADCLLEQAAPETPDVVDLIKRCNKLVDCPLLIVVDEFGKNLEFMTHNPSKGDIFALQLLAESGIAYIWVILHQAFGEYASSFSEIQKSEWSKIQGRFEDISYLEPPSRVVELISKAVSHGRLPKGLGNLIPAWSELHANLMSEVKISGAPRFSVTNVRKLYPIHPLAAILLGELSRRFGQNDRTIFSFLSNGGPGTFSDFLALHSIEPSSAAPTLSIDWLYDYFCETTIQRHGVRASTQRWIEIQSLITAHSDAPVFEMCLLKTIGVLNLLSDLPGVHASKKMIHVALGASKPKNINQIDKTLEQLVNQGVVLYRNYANEYRLWEGTDFDLESTIREERARLALGSIEDVLEIAAPQPNIIAARHSYQTGTTREFRQSWATLELLRKRKNDTLAPDMVLDGQIWLTLGKQTKPHNLKDKTVNLPVIIGYAPSESQVLDLALDAAAAKKVFETHSQLAHDGVARREARFRVEAASQALREYLNNLFSPASHQVRWYALGTIQNICVRRGLSSLISEICDSVYSKAPPVNMEMINYNRLSSAAARAQRELIEAMVTRETDEQLGLEGFGPEVAVYRALFKATGLHAVVDEADNRTWRFKRPIKKNRKQAKLVEVWNQLDKELMGAEHKNRSVPVLDLIQMLQRPPFGLREGPIPLFICHYLLVNDDEIALYQDGAFKPIFGKAEAALLLKRPDLFAMRRYAPQGLKRDVVQAYMMALNTDVLKLEPKTRNPSLLKIVAPLVLFMTELPDYTRFTRRLSSNAQKLRSAVLNSREPMDLLFRDIPVALGMPPFDGKSTTASRKTDLHQHLQNALIELNDAFDVLNASVRETLIHALGNGQTNIFSKFRNMVQARASKLVSACRDRDLKTILNVMKNSTSSDEEWTRGIAGIISKKPVDSWRDSDVEPWNAAIHEIADRLDSFETIVAGGIGIKNSKRLVISLTQGDGETERRIVDISKKDRKRLLKKYPSIMSESREERILLCALLLAEASQE